MIYSIVMSSLAPAKQSTGVFYISSHSLRHLKPKMLGHQYYLGRETVHRVRFAEVRFSPRD